MNAINKQELSAIDPDDIGHNTSDNPSFEQIVEARMSRRGLLRGGVGTAATALFGSMALAACGGGSDDPAAAPSPAPAPPPPAPAPPAGVTLNFNGVAKNLDDRVTIDTATYTATVLYRLGDPINMATPDYLNDGTDDAASYAFRAGDHHDGMEYFGLGSDGRFSATSSNRGLLCMNHEAITPAFLHPTGQTIVAGARTVASEVMKEFFVHGVSVIEVNRAAGTTIGGWTYNRASTFNRRVHTLTPMEITGPARGTNMVTRFSPTGTMTRGTVNNCAHGYTPWNTYLTCEENWAGYFRRVSVAANPGNPSATPPVPATPASGDNTLRSAKEVAAFNRYGINGTGRELWATVTPDTADNLYGRWRAEVTGATAADDYRNVANTYGWVVEIDPFTPNAVPKKRTALGRLGHEGAWLGRVVAGQPLVWYTGDDSRGEYIYKYVSNAVWDPLDATDPVRRAAAGDKYLDNGKLYVARFNADGTGTWLELAFGVNNITAAYAPYAFADAADVALNSRFAADAAGATRMDRPEWGGVNPANGDVFFTLTNNNTAAVTGRAIDATNAANPRSYNDPRTPTGAAQRGNPNGHIIRWTETGGNQAALSFRWDIYLFGARSGANANVNISGLSAGNDFSSPDGLWFSNAVPGLLWIQTDDGAYTDVTNCMMLAALPGRTGDGGARTITNTNDAVTPAVTRDQATFVGAPATDATLRRFLVGPKQCEITGITEAPDGRTIFVNIQHPGEDGPNNFTTNTFGGYWPYTNDATVMQDTSVAANRRRPRSATIVITRNAGTRIAVSG